MAICQKVFSEKEMCWVKPTKSLYSIASSNGLVDIILTIAIMMIITIMIIMMILIPSSPGNIFKGEGTFAAATVQQVVRWLA